MDFSFNFSDESSFSVTFSTPKRYVYEPNASILKAGGFKSVANRFGLNKLHMNTHLYTSESLVGEFPGRAFETKAIVKSDPKTISEYFKDGKANVITRNYALSSEELKKKLKLSDGGEKYLLAFAGVDKKYLIYADRLK